MIVAENPCRKHGCMKPDNCECFKSIRDAAKEMNKSSLTHTLEANNIEVEYEIVNDKSNE